MKLLILKIVFFLEEYTNEDNKDGYWEEFPNPHYAIKDNNIGIYFINKDDTQTNLEERSNGKRKKLPSLKC